MFANRLLHFEKFDAILRASRPRQTTPKTKLVSLNQVHRFTSRCVWLCIVLHLLNSMLL